MGYTTILQNELTLDERHRRGLETIQQSDETYQAFVHHVRQLAIDFEDEAILALVRRVWMKHNNFKRVNFRMKYWVDMWVLQSLWLNKLITFVLSIGINDEDNDEIRLKKNLIVSSSIMVNIAGIAWSFIYLFLHEPLAASVPFLYSLITSVNIIFFAFSSRYQIFRFVQLLLILFLPFFTMLTLGGFVQSSAVVIWSVLCPLGALLFEEDMKRIPRWFFAYLGILILSGVLEMQIQHPNNLSPTIRTIFFVMNIGAVSTTIFISLGHFVRQRNLFQDLAKQRLVTEMEAKQKQAQLLEAANRANQAKSEFLSNISHELRTPLNGILGYAHILKNDKTLKPNQINGLNIIQNSGQHLLTLINDLLDLARIESRKMELHPVDVRLSDFLKDITSLFHYRAEQQNIDFRLEASSDLPIGIRVDETRLRQILVNLLGNAIKFTEQGEVILKVSLVASFENEPKRVITEKQEQNGKSTLTTFVRLRFEVSDTGVGMTPTELEKIFQPFEQVGSKRKRSEGTGLGLAITHQLLALMGGELQVQSRKGYGSTFWFEVEVTVVDIKFEESKSLPKRIIGYTGAKRLVLVADDKEINRLVLKSILEPVGFKVVDVEDGQACVDQAQKLKPDIILTDLMMPVLNGLEAVKQIRQIPGMQEIPIIAVSASAYEKDLARSREVGCDDFLSKPVDEEILFKLLEKYLPLIWTYKENKVETQEMVKTSDLVLPPQADLETLYQLTQIGNIKKIRQWIIQIRQLDESYNPFADKVNQLARRFQLKQILALVESYLTEQS